MNSSSTTRTVGLSMAIPPCKVSHTHSVRRCSERRGTLTLSQCPKRWTVPNKPPQILVRLSQLAELRFEPGNIAGGEKARLLDPVVAPDAPGELPELVVDAVDVGLTPPRDVVEPGHAELVEHD